ncbi:MULTISPECIES: MarR family winged helix-turn-helix transcriptional regulator [Rhodococcus]|uniref:MarR family winged helix-turn-helix transcriptional regulator n=1 Tax=Rhodococcus oxybenzonivorans TaxID=1990687 RepID=A0AAE4V3X9_9NOCA|nr:MULTISPECIES: MarR family winged helix-turn-helix transcriptional regulator [Rhodococcus]MDV7243609.1 MarR family winged helix-turn-helix transcriptional regulator [Rhodococcus oxybenzonivorans]MDV7268526.1 MarR family winged helix-turn-helix transcriptional regulator [Rhodococcus oxybenzonivorans]MDV7275149.1 MarR family winged helix-turn-helix transcriptional regulator [Rhodococcus oxybenzonivorans]MDV7335387.1 MarR family winged helix-turn-helix transcriptional regulator [Rhodococcus oxyb
MSTPSASSVSSVSLGTTEALIDEVFLFGRVLRDALASEADDHLPRALTGVLLVLAGRGECRQNELATEMCVSQSSLSRQITDLVDAGYVTRHPDPADGRAFRIRVSDDGSAYVKHVRTRRAARMQKMLTGWNETEAATALDSIRHLKETLFDAEHRIVSSSNPIGTQSV